MSTSSFSAFHKKQNLDSLFCNCKFKNTFISRSSTFLLISFRLALIIFIIAAIDDSAGKKETRQGEKKKYFIMSSVFKIKITVFA